MVDLTQFAHVEKPDVVDYKSGFPVVCSYCGEEAELVDSREVYSRSYGLIWLCRPCKAWVGVHLNSKENAPLGRLADSTLRFWKKEAHAAFDPFWKGEVPNRRSKEYHWLSSMIGIKLRHCHIGMFNVEQCKKVVEICKNRR